MAWIDKDSAYEPLRDHLFFGGRGRFTLSFPRIEELLGRTLPPSARKRTAWWSNNASGHVQAVAWLDAGYRTTDLDLTNEQVTFVYTPYSGFSDAKQAVYAEAGLEPPKEVVAPIGKRLHPAFGSMQGTTIIVPGYDLTAPTSDLLDKPDGP